MPESDRITKKAAGKFRRPFIVSVLLYCAFGKISSHKKTKPKGVIHMTIFTVLFAILYAPFHIIFKLGKRYY